jgi:surface polysaccharide O-acyltransferase-like enzyme
MNDISIKKRSSNLELLRILSMVLIIAHHYSVHGGFNLNDNSIYFNKVIVQILSIGGKLGVNCFILITGYFMIDSCFKFKKLIKLWIEIFIYSVSITLIFYCLGISDFNIKYLVKSFLPITFNLYWFATTYVILYILTPFINVFINNVKKTTFLQLILLILTLWSIIPTFTNQEVGGTSVTWFITLYLIAAYIKKYPNTYCDKCLANILLAVIFYSLIIISVILFDIMGTKYSIFSNHATYLMGINKLPLVICSIALFLGFKNLKIEVNSFINSIAECMFGVYLIHDNSLVRTYIWLKLFKNNSFILSPYLLLHSIFAIITTFLICTFIDKLRIIFIERPIMRLIDTKWFIVQNSISSLKSKVNQLIKH